MEKYSSLNRVLMEAAPVEEKKIVNQAIPVDGLSITKLRDILIKIGKIQREFLEDKIYVGIIPGGFLKKNYAVVALQLYEDEIIIAAYAEEGFIEQHTCEGALNELRRNIQKFIRE